MASILGAGILYSNIADDCPETLYMQKLYEPEVTTLPLAEGRPQSKPMSVNICEHWTPKLLLSFQAFSFLQCNNILSKKAAGW